MEAFNRTLNNEYSKLGELVSTNFNDSGTSFVECIKRAAETDGSAMWFILIPFAHVLISGLLTWSAVLEGEVTKEGKMEMSHLMSYMFVSVGCVCYIVGAGLTLYFELGGVHDQYTILAQDTFYARSEFVERHLLIPMMAYQFWNTINCFVYKEFCHKTMILHHAAVVFLTIICFSPFLHPEGFFYLGMAEVTNIPLTWMDVCIKKPEWKDRWPFLHDLSQLTFAVTFIGIRLVFWMIRAIPVWCDLSGMLLIGNVRSYPVAVGFIVISGVLTVLQFIWGKMIIITLVSEVCALLSGKRSEKVATTKIKKLQ